MTKIISHLVKNVSLHIRKLMRIISKRFTPRNTIIWMAKVKEKEENLESSKRKTCHVYKNTSKIVADFIRSIWGQKGHHYNDDIRVFYQFLQKEWFWHLQMKISLWKSENPEKSQHIVERKKMRSDEESKRNRCTLPIASLLQSAHLYTQCVLTHTNENGNKT